LSKQNVEYLVTGTEKKQGDKQPLLEPEIRLLIDIAEKLNPKNRRIAVKMAKILKEQEDEEKKV